MARNLIPWTTDVHCLSHACHHLRSLRYIVPFALAMGEPRHILSRPSRPVLIFDGACGFCRFWAARWRRRTGDTIEYAALQEPEMSQRFPEVTREHLAHAVHLIEPDGRVSQGAEAVFRLLAVACPRTTPVAGWCRLPLALYERLPGAAPVAEWIYRFVANHRSFFSRLTALLWSPLDTAPTRDGPSLQYNPIVKKTDDDWRKTLTPEQFNVLRQHGTEPAGTSPLNYEKRSGTFRCAGCGQPLFSADTKFESGTGWPSFGAPLEGAIETSTDRSFGMTRVEVHCAACGGHLGHMFPDGPVPTGQRYCMNGVALEFEPEG